jgi:hypothetical protein
VLYVSENNRPVHLYVFFFITELNAVVEAAKEEEKRRITDDEKKKKDQENELMATLVRLQGRADYKKMFKEQLMATPAYVFRAKFKGNYERSYPSQHRGDERDEKKRYKKY